jgi:hypothetical protein
MVLGAAVNHPVQRCAAVVALATSLLAASTCDAASFRRRCLEACQATVRQCEDAWKLTSRSPCVRQALNVCRRDGIARACPKTVQLVALSDACVYPWCEFALCVGPQSEAPDVTPCDPPAADMVVRVSGQKTLTIAGTRVILGCQARLLPCTAFPCTTDCDCATNGPLGQCIDGTCQGRLQCSAP